MDKIDEKIGGLEIKYVFNRKQGESITPVPASTSNRKEGNPTTISSEPQLLLTKAVPNKVKDDAKGESQDKDIPNLLERNTTSTGSDKSQDQPFKKHKSDDIKQPEEKRVEVEVTRGAERLTEMPSKKSKVESSIKLPDDGKSKHEDKLRLDVNNLKSPGTAGTNSEVAKTDKVENNKQRNRTPTGSDQLHDRPLKKIRSDDKKPPNESQVDPERLTDLSSKKSMVVNKSKHEDKLPADVNNLKASGTTGEKPNRKNDTIPTKVTGDPEGKIIKKIRDDSAFKIPDSKKLGININGSNGKGLVATSELSKGKSKSGFGVDSIGSNKETKEDQSSESKKKLSASNSFKASASSIDKDKKCVYQEFVCGPKPNSDKSGWFRKLPWEDRLKNAYDQGTAILLHNLDPDYTSREVEDIIWHALKENCEAKILQRTAVSSPHYVQALILLKTKEATHRVLTQLDEECLMLSNRRPLVATPCPPILTKKNPTFFGHLAVDKARFQSYREDEAVSTSHFSQPNTIEYDMAMEWCLLQSRSKKCWDKFHKLQESELKRLEASLRKPK